MAWPLSEIVDARPVSLYVRVRPAKLRPDQGAEAGSLNSEHQGGCFVRGKYSRPMRLSVCSSPSLVRQVVPGAGG